MSAVAEVRIVRGSVRVVVHGPNFTHRDDAARALRAAGGRLVAPTSRGRNVQRFEGCAVEVRDALASARAAAAQLGADGYMVVVPAKLAALGPLPAAVRVQVAA